MAEEPVDEIATALFAAARRERPSDDVRARALAALSTPHAHAVDEAMLESPSAVGSGPVVAMRRRSRYGAAVAVALALAALLVVVVFYRGRNEPVFSIGPERSSQPEEARAVPSLRRVENEPVPEPVSPAPTVDKPARARVSPSHDGSSAQKVEVSPPASLPDEIAALDRARTALSSGDASGALRVLDDYERVLRGTRLTAEATLLRIDALARSGRGAEASDLAARFVEANPGSALADRARAFIKTSRSSRVDAGGSP